MWTNFALQPPITGVMVNMEQKITCRVHNSQKLYFKIKISFKLYEPVAEAMPGPSGASEGSIQGHG